MDIIAINSYVESWCHDKGVRVEEGTEGEEDNSDNISYLCSQSKKKRSRKSEKGLSDTEQRSKPDWWRGIKYNKEQDRSEEVVVDEDQCTRNSN
ncbi:hypothetical protein RSOLAG1IB_11391 [Rhizoctonia solani AG-1 IB]|uniref:Uncharacterized protein n=1 Tax=Thanatephorus cucumeris (strain AG1-IB / isolate 7/3/14) TaxID=1108050 RepID=A0A0B7F966_THACB|nr:hypothetical protein RSOLAG1IB_11391 [Rhizoctonia solani AG-1 IB]